MDGVTVSMFDPWLANANQARAAFLVYLGEDPNVKRVTVAKEIDDGYHLRVHLKDFKNGKTLQPIPLTFMGLDVAVQAAHDSSM